MPKNRVSPSIRYFGGYDRFFQFIYHQAMETPFLLLLFFALLIFFLIGFLFTGLYLLSNGLMTTMGGSGTVRLFDAFYFSITFPVIGFGGIVPVGTGRILSVFQVFIGLVFLSSLTGLIFARISKAKSPLVWSSPLVIHRSKNREKLQVRVTNILGNDVVNVQVSLYLQKIEKSPRNETLRKLIPVQLETSRIPLAAFSWILDHPLDKRSPLSGWSEKGVKRSDDRLIGFISGYDTTLGKEVFSYGKWSPDDIVRGTFENVILKYREDGDLRVHVNMDLSRLDSVIPER